jgi:integrase/recombinase XerC
VTGPRGLQLLVCQDLVPTAGSGWQACSLCGVPYAGECQILGRHLQWLALRGHAATTITSRRNALTRMGRALPVPVLEASAADLYAWRAGLTVTDEVVAHYVGHAQQLYLWAITEGLRADNPAEGLPVPRTSRRLPRPVSEDGLMAALAGAPARIRPWLVLAAWCGLRACEIAGLRRDSIMEDAQPPVLIVRADATKGTRERTVPLSAFVIAEVVPALPASGYAFRRCDGQAGPNKPWMISQLGGECLRNAGIPATLHQLRHRFGTQAYRASKDLLAVQDLLGHASPATTAAYCAYDRPEAVAAVEALPVPPRARHLHAVGGTR